MERNSIGRRDLRLKVSIKNLYCKIVGKRSYLRLKNKQNTGAEVWPYLIKRFYFKNTILKFLHFLCHFHSMFAFKIDLLLSQSRKIFFDPDAVKIDRRTPKTFYLTYDRWNNGILTRIFYWDWFYKNLEPVSSTSYSIAWLL